MKRIINGLTYNTDTSTRLARWQREGEQEETEGTLYQTRGGAFFVHWATTKTWYDREEGENKTKYRNEFEPMASDEAHTFIMTGDNEIFHNPFDDPPEADDDANSATVYVRLPASLKTRVEAAAAAANLSTNAWALRAFEKAAGRRDTGPADVVSFQPAGPPT